MEIQKDNQGKWLYAQYDKFLSNKADSDKGKYYSQSGVIYKCNRDTEQAVYQNLSDLVGLYVEIAKE